MLSRIALVGIILFKAIVTEAPAPVIMPYMVIP